MDKVDLEDEELEEEEEDDEEEEEEEEKTSAMDESGRFSCSNHRLLCFVSMVD